jgi:hypothetical protein
MTQKKAMEDAKTSFDKQVKEELHALEINNDAAQELEKMRTMELFINHPINDESDMEEENDELTQVELDELTASLSD